jgi:hypothetical protein
MKARVDPALTSDVLVANLGHLVLADTLQAIRSKR